MLHRARPLLVIAALAGCGGPADLEPGGLSIGGPDGSAAIDHVAVDPAGATFVGGRFEGTLALGDGAPITSVKQRDGFLARLDPDGRITWARGFAGLPADFNRDDHVSGVAAAADGSVVVTGYVEGTIDLGGGPLAGDGRGTLFIARYAADGTHLWSQRWPAGDFESYASAPVIAGDGSIYVTAGMAGGATIGSLQLDFEDFEIVIVKLTAGGDVQWARPLRPQPQTDPFSGFYSGSPPVVVGGDVYVSGGINGPVDLGTGPLAASEGYATYVVRLAAATGETLAVRGYADSVTPYGRRQIAASPDGELMLGGAHITRLAPDLSIASAIDLSALTTTDAYEGHLAFRADGELIWVGAYAYVRFGADGVELARETVPVRGDVAFNAVAVGPDDRIAIVGGHSAPFTLGGRTFAIDGVRAHGFIAWLP